MNGEAGLLNGKRFDHLRDRDDLPALYPNSHEHADDAVKLGRAADWKGGDGGPVLGAGLKVFLCGDADLPILEWRQLEMIPAGGAEEAEAPPRRRPDRDPKI